MSKDKVYISTIQYHMHLARFDNIYFIWYRNRKTILVEWISVFESPWHLIGSRSHLFSRLSITVDIKNWISKI